MVQRKLEFAVDDKMREVGAEAHLRNGVNQAQCGIEIIRNAVPVCLELDRHAHLFGHVYPAANDRDHALDAKRHHLADHINERGAEILRHDECIAKRFDGFGKGDDQRCEAITLHMRADLMRLRDVAGTKIDRHAVIAGFGDHRAYLVIGQDLAAVVMRHHRP